MKFRNGFPGYRSFILKDRIIVKKIFFYFLKYFLEQKQKKCFDIYKMYVYLNFCNFYIFAT